MYHFLPSWKSRTVAREQKYPHMKSQSGLRRKNMTHYSFENTGIFIVFERHEELFIANWKDICLGYENQTNLHHAKPKRKEVRHYSFLIGLRVSGLIVLCVLKMGCVGQGIFLSVIDDRSHSITSCPTQRKEVSLGSQLSGSNLSNKVGISWTLVANIDIIGWKEKKY